MDECAKYSPAHRAVAKIARAACQRPVDPPVPWADAYVPSALEIGPNSLLEFASRNSESRPRSFVRSVRMLETDRPARILARIRGSYGEILRTALRAEPGGPAGLLARLCIGGME